MTVAGEIPADTSSRAERPLRPTFDASDLPTVVYGSRVITWWGTAGFMFAEAATLAACVASYYYIRRNFEAWPPLRTPLLTALGVGLTLIWGIFDPIAFVVGPALTFLPLAAWGWPKKTKPNTHEIAEIPE